MMTTPLDQVKTLHEAGLFSSSKLLVSVQSSSFSSFTNVCRKFDWHLNAARSPAVRKMRESTNFRVFSSSFFQKLQEANQNLGINYKLTSLSIMYQSNRSLNIPPRAFEFLENFCSNSPPPKAEKLFKCPIIGPFQAIKCPTPGKLFGSFYYAPEAVCVNMV